jgi:hypothetical protein
MFLPDVCVCVHARVCLKMLTLIFYILICEIENCASVTSECPQVCSIRTSKQVLKPVILEDNNNSDSIIELYFPYIYSCT